ncbi:hypothetical protein [Maribacter halichondriae]|uniref:hypothetical protein n=1 Tax=Maribacter halichondriae TaxID=2980554 RepID=UPI002359AF7D|nr:hypothetical protein [Maribacter sp. Hal144]
MGKLTSLFLIVILFGCAKDSDLLPDPVFVQKVVEIEIREPGAPLVKMKFRSQHHQCYNN